ncbi:DNA-binding protein [Staphylococcus aureus]|nr:DNA-binding protein [Staphylococcus aureus]CAC9324582.1 DNA-binding protein [Staphylococcus aureus]CAC9328507.1 DNA-binding protein [Staphylococcus aureus]
MRNQIQKLLDSDLSSLHISKQTGVPQSTIHRMRKKRKIIRQYVIEKR